ncbi:MAG TPA: hypothetical protein VK737_04925 [Opitutales bacterium]|nr:hypothetical protein [Opitutales bacterium]
MNPESEQIDTHENPPSQGASDANSTENCYVGSEWKNSSDLINFSGYCFRHKPLLGLSIIVCLLIGIMGLCLFIVSSIEQKHQALQDQINLELKEKQTKLVEEEQQEFANQAAIQQQAINNAAAKAAAIADANRAIEKQNAANEIAMQLARRIGGYLDKATFPFKSGLNQVFVVIADKDGNSSWDATDRVVNQFTASGLYSSGKTFQQSFFDDHQVSVLRTDPAAMGEKLGLDASAIFVLGEKTVTISPPDSFGYVTADIRIDLVAYKAISGGRLGSASWKSSGAARQPEDAAQAALDRASSPANLTGLNSLVAILKNNNSISQ